MSLSAWFIARHRRKGLFAVLASLALVAGIASVIPPGARARSQALISQLKNADVPRDRKMVDVLLDELFLIGDDNGFREFRTFLQGVDVDYLLGVETPSMTLAQAIAKVRSEDLALQASRDELFNKVVPLNFTVDAAEGTLPPLDDSFEVTPGLWVRPVPQDDQYPVEYYLAAQYHNGLAVPAMLKSRIHLSITAILECPPTEVAPGAEATVICHATEADSRIRGDEATYAGMLDLKRHGVEGATVERTIEAGVPVRKVVETPRQLSFGAYEPAPEIRSAALAALKELGCAPAQNACQPSPWEKLYTPAVGNLLIYALLAGGILYLHYRSLVEGAPRRWLKAIFAMYAVVASTTLAFANAHSNAVTDSSPYTGFFLFLAQYLLSWPWTRALLQRGGPELLATGSAHPFAPFLLINMAFLGALAFMPAPARRSE